MFYYFLTDGHFRSVGTCIESLEPFVYQDLVYDKKSMVYFNLILVIAKGNCILFLKVLKSPLQSSKGGLFHFARDLMLFSRHNLELGKQQPFALESCSNLITA